MRLTVSDIQNHNDSLLKNHHESFAYLREQLLKKGANVDAILEQLMTFQVAIPSWALGAGGTRFGRFSIGGEPANLHQKIEDIGIIHALTNTAGAISLHIPWDIPEDPEATKELAASLGIAFDAVNSNTFQDQPGQKYSYKFLILR